MLMHHRCISILSVKFFCDFCGVFILLWFGFILFVCFSAGKEPYKLVSRDFQDIQDLQTPSMTSYA